jgi:hypothetical protein
MMERLKKGTGVFAHANIRHAVPLKLLDDRAPSPAVHMGGKTLSVNRKA